MGARRSSAPKPALHDRPSTVERAPRSRGRSGSSGRSARGADRGTAGRRPTRTSTVDWPCCGVELFCDGTRTRVALGRAFADALGLNFIDHFPRALAGCAGDPDRDLDSRVRDVTASEALEAADRGVERESVVAPGRFAIRHPRSGPAGDAGTSDPSDHPRDRGDGPAARSAVLRAPPGRRPPRVRARCMSVTRSRRSPRADRRGSGRVRSSPSVDPDAWHPVSEAETRGRRGGSRWIPGTRTGAGTSIPDGHRPGSPETPVPIYVQGRWASVRLKDRVIVVRAPAFVLMGIEGLPKPVPPPAILLEPR